MRVFLELNDLNLEENMAKRSRVRASARTMSLLSRTRPAVRATKVHALTKARATRQVVAAHS